MAIPKTTNRIHSLEDLSQARALALEQQPAQAGYVIYIGTATCGLAAGAAETLQALRQSGPPAAIVETGCIGLCSLEPVVEVRQPGCPPVLYGPVTPQAARRIVQEHILQGKIVTELVIANQEILTA
jgi:NADP-reducing hydrogenase subunit HndB